jgi:hypothetical protein
MNTIASMLALSVLALASATSASTLAAGRNALDTLAEQSAFQRTGRYAEVTRLCGAFAQHYPEQVRCERFGTTPEGRAMHVLIASASGAFDPDTARRENLPVVLVQGGIHAGEIDGKDAGFLALREVLEGKAAKDALQRQVLLFVPVFNVDGHERFGRWNRPNQRGPEEMGWRTTAQNYNLNRDYLKADAPEMQAMLGLMRRWDPIATIDLHVTNGAQFRHDVSIQVEPLHSGDVALRGAGREFRDAVIASLAAQGSHPLPFYPSFIEHDNPASGIADGVAPPRFSSGYLPLRNRFGMLVETHSWKDYPTRVRITRNTVIAVLEQVASKGRDWLALAQAADVRSSALAGHEVELDWKADATVRTMDFLGYEYSRLPSDVSGALMTRYDESRPAIWKMPVQDRVVPAKTIDAPRAGYLVPAAHATLVAERLDRHGVRYRRVDRALPAGDVEAFRAVTATFDATSTEGHQRLAVTGEWRRERLDLASGALFVPIDQALARIAIALLEPQAPDSLLAWGLFNNHFEAKEYMEAYVAEAVAREMMARDPALKAEFERRVAVDAAFAADAQARLAFFHRRHSSWDERLNLYPILRSDQVPR